jgi:multidrug efflux pump subunit AcrB
MVMLGSVVDFSNKAGPGAGGALQPLSCVRVQGDTLPGTSSATALGIMRKLANQTLPSGFSFEWTDLSYQQATSAMRGSYIFPICVLFVFWCWRRNMAAGACHSRCS